VKPAVTIRDVGPRDGLQNQPRLLEPAARVRLVRALLEAGLRDVEAGAFVSPRAVPAMSGTDEVLAGLADVGDAVLTVLVPNLRGYELARQAGARSVCMVLYGSERMAQANVRMTRAQAADTTETILEHARNDGVRVTATVAVAFQCPWEGLTDQAYVAALAERFLNLGVDEFCLADTIGAADPRQVARVLRPLVDVHGPDRLGCHFHDTRAMGLANVYAAVEAGVRRFDAAIGGLGGCPFAPGASGNVATEDVVMMLEQMGMATGVDPDGLLRASELATELTGTAPGGRARPWLLAQRAEP
jgi:hydroxymethylglutaryl-CoA lyase